MTAAAHRRVRPAALVIGGALALHELRYLLVYHDRADEVLAMTGHHYLSLITPLVAGLLVCALQPFLALAGRAPARSAPAHGARPGRSLVALWATASGCLVGAYAAQEWLEGKLVAAHPGGAGGVLGDGGWSALALAAALGLLVALAMRGAREARALVVRVVPPSPLPAPPPVRAPVPRRATPRDAVACHLAGRGPPLRTG